MVPAPSPAGRERRRRGVRPERLPEGIACAFPGGEGAKAQRSAAREVSRGCRLRLPRRGGTEGAERIGQSGFQRVSPAPSSAGNASVEGQDGYV